MRCNRIRRLEREVEKLKEELAKAKRSPQIIYVKEPVYVPYYPYPSYPVYPSITWDTPYYTICSTPTGVSAYYTVDIQGCAT